MNTRPIRLVGAALTLVGGAVHLQQWWRVFRHLDIGPAFVANTVVSVVVGALLIATDDRRAAWGAIVLAAASLAALLASRTIGFLGFEATGIEAPEIVAIVAEIGVVLVLVLLERTRSLSAVPVSPSDGRA